MSLRKITSVVPSVDALVDITFKVMVILSVGVFWLGLIGGIVFGIFTVYKFLQ